MYSIKTVSYLHDCLIILLTVLISTLILIWAVYNLQGMRVLQIMLLALFSMPSGTYQAQNHAGIILNDRIYQEYVLSGLALLILPITLLRSAPKFPPLAVTIYTCSCVQIIILHWLFSIALMLLNALLKNICDCSIRVYLINNFSIFDCYRQTKALGI